MSMKTPEQIADERLAEVGYAGWYRPYQEQVREDIVAAIEADRAQREGMPFGRARFTVEFDNPAWASMTPDGRQEWVDKVVSAISGEAYVTQVEVGK